MIKVANNLKRLHELKAVDGLQGARPPEGVDPNSWAAQAMGARSQEQLDFMQPEAIAARKKERKPIYSTGQEIEHIVDGISRPLTEFGKSIGEIPMGALYDWSSGRYGKPYPEDSYFIDAMRRVSNKLPGVPVPLKFKSENDPFLNDLLGRSGWYLGIGGLAGLAAGARVGSRPLMKTLNTTSRTRDMNMAQKGLAATKEVVKATTLPTVLATIENAASKIAPGVEQVHTHQEEAEQVFKLLGYSTQKAKELANKVGWGALNAAVKEYINNPYYYIYRQGGTNPIDQAFSSLIGSPLPTYNPLGALQSGRLALSSPTGVATQGVLTGASNMVSDTTDRLKDTYQAAKNEASDYINYTDLSRVNRNREILEQSRMVQALKQHFGKDWQSILDSLSEEEKQRLEEQSVESDAYGAAPNPQHNKGLTPRPFTEAND